MKKIQVFLLALLLAAACLNSCQEDKQDCECNAYTIGSAEDYRKDAQLTFCHNGKDIEVSVNSAGHGTTHEDGTECYVGSCGTLGLDDIDYIPYSNNCADNNKTVRIDGTPYVVICEEFQ